MCYLIEYIVAYRMEISTSLRKKMRSVAAGYGLTAGEGKRRFATTARRCNCGDTEQKTIFGIYSMKSTQTDGTRLQRQQSCSLLCQKHRHPRNDDQYTAHVRPNDCHRYRMSHVDGTVLIFHPIS